MSNHEQQEPIQEFEQRCIDVIKRIRAQSYEILAKAGRNQKAPELKGWEKIVFPLLGFKPEDFIDFDSNRDSRLALVLRAIAQDDTPPRIKIFSGTDLNETSAMKVTLSGKQPSSGEDAEILSIQIPERTNSVTETKVIFWIAPLPKGIPFWEVMDSNYAELINLTTKSLEAINRSLPDLK